MNKMLFKIIILTILTIMSTSCMCYADYVARPSDGGGTSTSENGGSGSVGLPSLDLYEPSPAIGTSAKGIIETFLGWFRVIGIILILVAIALIGFNTIMGSASEKAEGQGKYVGLIIAAALLTGGSWIAEMIISVAESL